MRVAIFGLGYVGTVTAAGLASQGHDVVGVDVERSKVAAICRGESPVVEPGVDRLVAQAVSAGRLRATTEVREAIEGAEVSLVCVGTPSMPRGDTNLSYIARALGDLREAMADVAPPPSGFHSVVIRSTVPPGTGSSVVEPAFSPELLPAGWTVGTAMCPEFLREGCGVEDFFAPPFVVLGARGPSHQGDLREAVRLPRPGDPARRRAHRRGTEVRLQRLPRRQGDLRQRDGPASSRSTAWTRAASWRSSARTASSTSRPATCGPGSRSAGPACPRTCAPCRAWRGRAASTSPSSAPP